MSLIGRYEMRVEGILSGTPDQNQARILQVQRTLNPNNGPPYPGQGDPAWPPTAAPAPWPDGFILINGWRAYIWECGGRPNAHNAMQTNLFFHAEVAGVLEGTTHDIPNQNRATLEFGWFLTHDKRGWCTSLMDKLMMLSDEFKKDGVLVEELRMRRFHWYLGNGGC